MLLLANRFPFVAVSIAFAVNKEVSKSRAVCETLGQSICAFLTTDFFFQLEFGVVYSCLEDKMYKARKGKGAFCNDELIRVSDIKGNAANSLSWLLGAFKMESRPANNPPMFSCKGLEG